MNPFLMAYANSYDNGQKLYEDLPTSYQGTPEPDNSGFAYGGQAAGQTAADVAPPTPYQHPYTTSGMFGSGAATQGRTPEQLNTIKNAWSQYSAGQMPATEIKKAMEQYGVNFADIAAATGLPIDSLVSSLNQGLSAPKPQTPAVPTYGSPYNPGITAPNPDGSGRPLGTTHPASGMVNLQSGDSDYNTQLQNYYKAYFGGASPDMGMLNSWYSSDYTPRATGYQKDSGKTTTPSESDVTSFLNVIQGGSRNGTLGNQAPGSPLGTGVMTDAIRDDALNTFKKYIGLGLTPAAAMAAVQSVMATNQALNAVNESEDPIGALINMQNVFGSDTGSTSRAPSFGSIGNSSFGEGQY